VPVFFGIEAELNGSFWHDYNRSGTLTFKVKMAGILRYYRSADPYKSHNAKRDWFVLVCDVIMLQAYSIKWYWKKLFVIKILGKDDSVIFT